MLAVVTGCAGFIGSSLTDELLRQGHEVVGLDCFTPYYDPGVKRANLASALAAEHFRLEEVDLRVADLEPVLGGADAVFHLAGQPGVRPSWSDGFADYDSLNVLATQRLLEAATAVGCPRLVYASSSSIYGEVADGPVDERCLPAPHSPYGVTKLAAEHLCRVYARNFDLPTVCLRYFSVYGPRQRPDMAMHRLLTAGLTGAEFPLYGTGDQVRDFTYVGDVVAATIAAAEVGPDVAPGTTLNIGGGSEIAMQALIDIAAAEVGRPIRVAPAEPKAGDVRRTSASIELARATLGWVPRTPIDEGVRRQAAWHRGEG